MNQQVTTAVLIMRRNFGEADRIITVITPHNGKLTLLAKGVRKVKSKLAGGIELFSISSITYIPAKKEIGTLISSRLLTHFNAIVEDLDRTMVGYDMLKLIQKATQTQSDTLYYQLLIDALGYLNDTTIPTNITHTWFVARLLDVIGVHPNVETDTSGKRLDASKKYVFDFQAMSFNEQSSGMYAANEIKLLRLYQHEVPLKLHHITDSGESQERVTKLLQQIVKIAML